MPVATPTNELDKFGEAKVQLPQYQMLSLSRDFDQEDFRHAYVEAELRRGIAYQIREMRDYRKMSQAQLGRAMNTPQSNISRLENPQYGRWSLQTLIDLARVFDVALLVRFVTFQELFARTENVEPSALNVRPYEETKAAPNALARPPAGIDSPNATLPGVARKERDPMKPLFRSYSDERDPSEGRRFGPELSLLAEKPQRREEQGSRLSILP